MKIVTRRKFACLSDPLSATSPTSDKRRKSKYPQPSPKRGHLDIAPGIVISIGFSETSVLRSIYSPGKATPKTPSESITPISSSSEVVLRYATTPPYRSSRRTRRESL
jgi:hypothetical protein